MYIIMQNTPSTDDRTPLLGPTLTVPVVVPGQTPTMRVEDEDTENGTSSGSDEDGENDMAPIIKLGSQRNTNPLMRMLLAFWPFGESFKELGLIGKFYEIVKVVLLPSPPNLGECGECGETFNVFY